MPLLAPVLAVDRRLGRFILVKPAVVAGPTFFEPPALECRQHKRAGGRAL